MKQQNNASPIGIGALSVLTVLLVVTLAVFAVLTLTSAQADYALSERASVAVADYYAAEITANNAIQAFLLSDATSLDGEAVIDDHRVLSYKLVKTSGGEVEVWRWQVQPSDEEIGRAHV